MTEFVERPAMVWKRPGKYAVDFAGLLATAENGKALRVPLNGAVPARLRDALRESLRRAGYRLRGRRDGDALVCWVVRR